MSTIVAKLYGADAADGVPDARVPSRKSDGNSMLDTFASRVRAYFRNQSELRIERLIAENGGKLTDSIEREISRRLERGL